MPTLEFIEVPQPFEKRFSMARRYLLSGELNGFSPNCFSTGLFLFGISPYDIAVFPIGKDKSNVTNLISLLEELEWPKDNSLIVSHNVENEIIHFSFLKESNPLIGYQRKGLGGTLYKFVSIKEIEEYLEGCEEGPFNHRYYSKGNNEKELIEYSREIISRYNSLLASDIALNEIQERLENIQRS